MNKTTEALKLSTVALKDIACTSQTDDLLWWQIRAREALAAIREALFEQGVPIVDEYGVTCRAAKTKAEQALQNLSDFHQYMEATEPEYYDCGGTIGVVHKSQCSAAMKRNGKPWKCACGANLYIDSNGAPASKAEHKCSEHKCSEHPDAPHGFDRNASHNAGRYVCECEGWEPDEPVQEPIAWFKHGPYDDGEELVCIFQDPKDDVCYSPLYAAPVSSEREWVDITKAEQLYLLASHIDKLTGDVMGLSLIDAVIAAFKEKNK